MRDIARIAGVSTATISRVINNSDRVDRQTADRIRSIIQDLNYIPNSTGTALKSGRSGIYGLIVPNISNSFFADFISQFEREVVTRDQEMMLAITAHSHEEMQRSIRRMLMRGVEAIAVLESEIETTAYESMLHNRVPLVTLNRLAVEPGVSDVAVEAFTGMKLAIQHLVELGHSRIGFLGGRAHQTISAARESAFRKAMRANRLEIIRPAIQAADFSIEGGRRAMSRLISRSTANFSPVTAVLCANDLSAIGAMLAIRNAGLIIGQDISVIGLDDIDLCTIVDPPLTTLHLSRKNMVSLFLEAMDNLLSAPHETGQQLNIHVDLVIRGSTGPCRPCI
jgi:LacI family transcriptional regulator